MCALAKFVKYRQHTKKTEGLVQSYSSTAQIFSQIAYYLYLFSLPQMAVIVLGTITITWVVGVVYV